MLLLYPARPPATFTFVVYATQGQAKRAENHNTEMPKKRKKPKRKKLPKLTTLKNKALRLWTEKVLEIHGGKCAVCGGTETLNCHHIEDKCNYALRWDVINGICLCAGCHNFRKDSAHRSVVFFYEWLSCHRPRVIEYIRQHRHDELKHSNREVMNDIIEKLSRPVEAEVLGMLNLASSDAPEPAPSSTSPTPLF
jgi:hypothetical protein